MIEETRLMLTMIPSKQKALKLRNAQKYDLRTQFAALCYRIRKDKVQVLLITSRGTGRWIIPKGWPMDGATPAKAAKVEAWEEAGVQGRVFSVCIGLYTYFKYVGEDRLPCMVAVFPLAVKRLSEEFPEAGARRRKWVSPKKAAKMVDQPELGQLIAQFDPRGLRP
ncbi:MAG: 8-oxo-dGTP pyrophosphatase MutT (NUDIX family) [Halocynthiibacter sp.]